jgi:hypothetical protein
MPSNIDPKLAYTIKQAALACSLDPMWVRRMVQESKLDGCYQENVPGTTIKRWMIPGASLIKHAANAKQSKRTDGATKFTMYADRAMAAKLEELAKANGLVVTIQRANTPEQIAKRYAHQKAQRALAKANATKASAASKQRALAALRGTVSKK